MKVCPADWMEGIAMVVSGGIYCQYKQAEYIMEDLKSEIQRVHAEGEAERDALIAGYTSTVYQQKAQYDQQVSELQGQLQDLLNKTEEMLRILSNGGVGARAKTTRLATEASLESLMGRGTSTISVAKKFNPRSAAAKGVVGDSRLARLGNEVQLAIETSKAEADAQVSGPFTAARMALDQLTRDFVTELSKGFESEFAKPLIAIVSGLPPPDPLTLVVIMNASKLELLRVWNAKNAWLADLRSRKDAELESSFEAMEAELLKVMARLEVAIKRALKLIQALEDALENRGQSTEDVLAEAIAMVRKERASPAMNVMASVAVPPNPRQIHVLVPQTALDGAVRAAVRITEISAPAKATPAVLSTLTLSAKTTVRDRAAGGEVAKMEEELRARFATEPDTLNKVVDWLRIEARQS